MKSQDLYKKYPAIFANTNGIDIDDGWADLVDQLCDFLQMQTKNNNLQVVATQCKTKFGGLRFYTERVTREQQWVINFVENMSYRICEECGSNENVGQTSGSWITTVCKRCFDKNKEKYGGKTLVLGNDRAKPLAVNGEQKPQAKPSPPPIVILTEGEIPPAPDKPRRWTENEKTQMVQDCQTVAELKDVIKKIAPVQGSQKLYEAEKLLEKIEQVKLLREVDYSALTIMTRTHGLRAKLMELMFYEEREK